MSINWNSRWVLPFESPWSIIEKIKYANLVNTRQVLRVLGTESARRNHGGLISKIHRDLFDLSGIDDETFEKVLGFSLHNLNKSLVDKLTHPLPEYVKRKGLFRQSLTYCKQCINKGYHSLFHQYTMVNRCPFHLCKLEDVCLHCKTNLPYMITSHAYESGFLCEKCGDSLVTDSKGYSVFTENWCDQPILNDDKLVTWIQLNGDKKERINNAYLFTSHLTNSKNALDHLLKICNPANEPRLQYIDKQKHNTNNEINSYDMLYNHLWNILVTFESFLMRTILSDHKHCIKRFLGLIKRNGGEFPPICPYAYAYVFWRESFYDINPFYNDPAPKRRRGLNRYTLPFVMDSELVDEFIRLVLNDTDDQVNDDFILGHIHWKDISKNINTLLWLTGHFVWNLAMDHFIEWLKLSGEYAAKQSRPVTRFNNFQPYSSIYSFVRTKGRIELNVSRDSLADVTQNFICPYKEPKFKSVGVEEKSYLPLRLIIGSGSEEEKNESIKYLAGLKVFGFIK